MEYDFRARTGSPYDSGVPSYSRPPPSVPSSAAAHPTYGQPSSLYPKVGGAGAHSASAHGRNPPFHHAPSPPSVGGTGIRVSIKSEYRISPPPSMLPQLGEIPRSNFHFDFDFERNVLNELVKENPDWSRLGLENFPPKANESASYVGSQGRAVDPVVNKYMASGLNREAVPLAVANYGDNPTKVREFCKGYTLLREMGFTSNNVAEALLMYDNDTDKALAHFLNNTA